MTFDVQAFQLLVGSGILVLMFRLTFQVGRYSNRLESLERESLIHGEQIKRIDRNVTVLLADLSHDKN
jgi:hypothetical protein